MNSRLRLLALALAATLSAPAHAQLVGGQWETKWQFDGQEADDRLGYSVSGAGDVDGDGFDDLIVGTQYTAPGNRLDAGSAYVYSGATGALIWRFDGQAAGDHLGESVSGAGDVDGDGFDDLIIGAHLASPGGLLGAGAAYVYSGATGNLLWQFIGQPGDDMGSSVSGAGDVDGDGFDDLIVGAEHTNPGGVTWAGSAYVYSGATGALLWQFDGLTFADGLGGSVSGAGDVDGDGFDDLIAGAQYADPFNLYSWTGSAYVYSGATGNLLWHFGGQATYGQLGASVSGAGDVDGDGFDDLIVGAFREASGNLAYAGAAYVYSGATGALLWQLHGQTAQDRLGSSVSGAGDVNGDGFDDLIVGAYGADPGGILSDAGSAYVYSGATGALLWQFDGQSVGDGMGTSVSGAGDLDGDGFDELIVGAGWANPGGLGNAGSTYVFSLRPFLHLDSTEISHSVNQSVQLGLDFPATEADAHYAILLSITGAGPSVFHGLDIPLTQDTQFLRLLGSPFLVGTLNANAQALHPLRLHSQTPSSAIGKTIHLAAVTFDTGTQAGRMSSVVRYLQIVP